jgi:hypothetical protein
MQTDINAGFDIILFGAKVVDPAENTKRFIVV